MGAQVTGKMGIAYTPIFGAVIVLLAILLIVQVKKSESPEASNEMTECKE